MKKSFLLAAAATLAMAVPGVAGADTGGAVGVAYAGLDSDDPGLDDFGAIGGIVASDLGGAWSVQATGVSTDMSYDAHDHIYGLFEVGANHRFSDNWAFGGFVGHLNDDGAGFWTYGLGTRADFGSLMLGASVSAASDSNSSGADDYTNVTLKGGFALTPQWRLGALASWSDFDFEEVESYGVSVDFHVNSLFAIGAFYRSSEIDWPGGCCTPTETDAFGAKLTLNFGDDMSRSYIPGSEQMVFDALARH